MASKPEILCLDEPLSALDESTRKEMFKLLKSIQEQTGVTTLHISHLKTEARILGDTILLLEDGQIEAVDKDQLASEEFEENELIHD